jgi:hypothetical protein
MRRHEPSPPRRPVLRQHLEPAAYTPLQPSIIACIDYFTLLHLQQISSEVSLRSCDALCIPMSVQWYTGRARVTGPNME